MEITFNSLSHGIGSAAYFLLCIFALKSFFNRASDRAVIIASFFTGLWLLVLTCQAIYQQPPFFIRYAFELLRYAAWFSVLYVLLGLRFFATPADGMLRFTISSVVLGLLSATMVINLYEGISERQVISAQTLLLMQVCLTLCGVLLTEQVWRNVSLYSREGIRYLIIAMAVFFVYDFLIYTDALLFKEISSSLWDARGTVNAVAAPLIALSLVNSRKQPLRVNVSRQVVFHTTTFTLAGIYLILISAGGYYVSIFGGTWGEALRVLFIAVSVVVLVILLSSPVLRAKIMVFISKNFFDYKYDYRDEWIKSTRTLAASQGFETLAEQAIRVLASLVGSQSGAVWTLNDEGNYAYRASVNMPGCKFGEIEASSDIAVFFSDHDWILNLDEYMVDPTRYNLIEIPDTLMSQPKPWLIIPLRSNDGLAGIILLCSPLTHIELNWENYDLMKIVSQQASSYLVQHDSQEQLAASRQFEAVNKTSAFLVHDLKTIIAQMSLLVRNAEKHKQNPVFIDDMISTTAHTVEKMDHLLKQIRNPNQTDKEENVELSEILLAIYQDRKKVEPTPILELANEVAWVRADRKQLQSAIGHIVTNAQEASSKDSEVQISTKISPGFIFLFIQDNGVGMSEEFITNNLFKPFDSTKGLTGMGIGVYQCREYMKKIGGSVNVTSEPGVGTCFTLKIPTVTV